MIATKHLRTLRRRLRWVEQRDGGSFDTQEADALRAVIEHEEQSKEKDKEVKT